MVLLHTQLLICTNVSKEVSLYNTILLLMVDCYYLLLRSSASGQKKPVSDFSGWIMAIYKGLSGRPCQRKLPSPHETWCTVNTSQFLKRDSEGLRAPDSQALAQICIPSPKATTEKPIYLGHLAKVFFRGLCSEHFIEGRRETLKTPFSTVSELLFHS